MKIRCASAGDDGIHLDSSKISFLILKFHQAESYKGESRSGGGLGVSLINTSHGVRVGKYCIVSPLYRGQNDVECSCIFVAMTYYVSAKKQIRRAGMAVAD
jgi:hypothetical protein